MSKAGEFLSFMVCGVLTFIEYWRRSEMSNKIVRSTLRDKKEDGQDGKVVRWTFEQVPIYVKLYVCGYGQ